ASHNILAFRLAQIHAYRLLAARLRFPPYRRALVQQAPLAQGVSLARRFDLDDFRAKVGQGLGGEWPGNKLPEFDDTNAGKNLCGHRVSTPNRVSGNERLTR